MFSALQETVGLVKETTVGVTSRGVQKFRGKDWVVNNIYAPHNGGVALAVTSWGKGRWAVPTNQKE